MMFESILKPEVQAFIQQEVAHKNQNLAFKKNPFPEIDWTFLLAQVEARQRIKSKLPSWHAIPNLIFSRKISLEQCSSEVTAQFKANLMQGNSIVDLSGGLGVDAWAFSKNFESVYYCELQSELVKIAKHNFDILEAKNIKLYEGDSQIWLQEIEMNFDVIYVDPSRRNDKKGKVFLLEDCEPNVIAEQMFWLKKAKRVFIKTSPLLDLHWGFTNLHHVNAVHVISAKNEVKELVWELTQDEPKISKIHVHELFPKPNTLTLFTEEEEEGFSPCSLPKNYLYDPHPALMKTGKFEQIAQRFNVFPLHQHAHIYTSDDKKTFFGKCFAIKEVLLYDKKTMQERFKNQSYQIAVRHFPERVDELRKKWNIKESEENIAYFTTNQENQKIILICTKEQTHEN
jgi:16S rRNA G966 N2-methylase RsmD